AAGPVRAQFWGNNSNNAWGNGWRSGWGSRHHRVRPSQHAAHKPPAETSESPEAAVQDTPLPYDHDLERLSENSGGRCISCAASATAAKARNGGARRRP